MFFRKRRAAKAARHEACMAALGLVAEEGFGWLAFVSPDDMVILVELAKAGRPLDETGQAERFRGVIERTIERVRAVASEPGAEELAEISTALEERLRAGGMGPALTT